MSEYVVTVTARVAVSAENAAQAMEAAKRLRVFGAGAGAGRPRNNVQSVGWSVRVLTTTRTLTRAEDKSKPTAAELGEGSPKSVGLTPTAGER